MIYGYDGLNRPTSILRSGTTTLAAYGYDAAGRRTAFNQGFTTSYGYDTAGRLTTLTNNLAASAYNNQYTFSYNPAGQITQVTRSNDTFAWTAHINVDRPYTTNGRNQYITAGAASFGYDANGNLTSDGATAFTYDAENRLVAASGAKTAGLRYDPLGRLYEVSGPAGTTRFLYDGDALIGEYDSAGNLLRRYVHGADSAADDPLAWYEGSAFTDSAERLLRSDWQGSIVVVANRPGSTVLAVNRYDEYGIPQSTNAGRFQYTGQAWLPELGMYHYKARMYSPTLGRFMQTDPIGYDDGINWYAYVGNDPVNHVDPDGEALETPWDAVNVAMGVASAVDNASEGNWGAAAVDAGGVVLDGIATAVPFVPAGAATALKVIRNADKVDDAAKAVKRLENAVHANKLDERPATLYEKYDKSGNFQKHGITKHENPEKRYTAKQINGGTVVRTERGPRIEIAKKERDLVERRPGPDNREPWAGKRRE